MYIMKEIIEILNRNGLQASLILHGIECNGIKGVINESVENDMPEKVLFLKPGEENKWNLRLTRHIITTVSMLTHIPGPDYNVILVDERILGRAEAILRKHFA